jgi:hypothetical protein
MLELRTERLQLIALTLSQLELYMAAPGQQEQELRLSVSRAITAPSTERSNIASNRVLEKVRMRISGETYQALDWRLDRADND